MTTSGPELPDRRLAGCGTPETLPGDDGFFG